MGSGSAQDLTAWVEKTGRAYHDSAALVLDRAFMRPYQNRPTQSVIGKRLPREDESAAKFRVMVGVVADNERDMTFQQSCAMALVEFKGQHGGINGLKFFRQTAQGQDAKDGLVVRALVYHGRDGESHTHILRMDPDPNFAPTRPMLDAAARTFGKR